MGGTRLTVKMIQKTLPGIEINHVVNTNFKGFQALVNKVDCVYVDIDRRYFNDNAIAYATIDVKPGYQKMCGSRALDYVRFRHEDTDLVRGARQQDFIRQARSQVGVKKHPEGPQGVPAAVREVHGHRHPRSAADPEPVEGNRLFRRVTRSRRSASGRTSVRRT